MDYRIEKKEAFSIMGIGREFTTVNNQNFKQIPEFWTEVHTNGTFKDLLKESKSNISYGICMDFKQEEEKFNYYIATNHQPNTKYQTREIPACTWAIFDASGKLPECVQDVTNRIYQEWFPATGYEHADAPEIEVYYSDDMDSDFCKCEIWIPIKN